MIKAVRITHSTDLQSALLCERVKAGRNDRTLEFAILGNGSEAGLLIYEDLKPHDSFIYEIFVLDEFRNTGIGTWILSYAEQIAAQLGRSRIRLTARSLYQAILNDEDLMCWYERRGYTRIAIEKGAMEKNILPNS